MSLPLTFKNSTFCPQNVFMCSVRMFVVTNSDYFLNVNRFVFVMETVSVFCEIGTKILSAV